MIASWLTLRDLEYVIAVAKFEHFGRAARECRVSQPSLSVQIKKIEGYLGVTLFERTNRRVVITLAGKKMAEQATVVLDEARKIPVILGQTTAVRSMTLKFGVISSLAPLVPYVLATLKKDFPKATLALHEATTLELVRELKSGVLDAVIAADTVKDETLSKVPLFFEPFVLAAPKGHSILLRSKPRVSDLKASEMVLLDEGHCLRDQVMEFCPTSRRGKPREFHASSVDTLRHLVASGAGYTLLPGLAAKESRLVNLISYLKFEDAKVGRKVVLLYREKSESLMPIEKLAQTLVRAVPGFI